MPAFVKEDQCFKNVTNLTNQNGKTHVFKQKRLNFYIKTFLVLLGGHWRKRDFYIEVFCTGAISDTSTLIKRSFSSLQVLLNLWATHHDPLIWKDPWRFNPRRFLDETGNLLPCDHETRRRYQYLMFCFVTASLMIWALHHNFKISLMH